MYSILLPHSQAHRSFKPAGSLTNQLEHFAPSFGPDSPIEPGHNLDERSPCEFSEYLILESQIYIKVEE